MTSSQDQGPTYEEFSQVVSEVFAARRGESPPSPEAASVARESVELFERAGFCAEDAQRGARLLEGGDFLGFEHVALSMEFDGGSAFRERNAAVTPERVAEVAKSITKGGDGGATTVVHEGGRKTITRSGDVRS